MTATPGKRMAFFNVIAAAGPIPSVPTPATISAVYAGKTLSTSINLAPPRLVSLELSSDVVVAGETVDGTVSLNYAPQSESVEVSTESSSGLATLPASVAVDAGASFGIFEITTPDTPVAFAPTPVQISASYGGTFVSATLTVTSRVPTAILKSLELFPSKITGGGSGRATLVLLEAVAEDMTVGLSAMDTSGLPEAGDPTDLVSIPGSVTVPKGHDQQSFVFHTAELPPGSRRVVTMWAHATTSVHAELVLTG